ncbi:hypothetical protein L3Q82_026333 [Scortum barcoo]|uniref:Uncharacterized protein n=1 Tax=Scortum barcoo TaxID=214431 RepID=A0ACB8WHR1_9TELE|nr:hypothetical protein L3Q82_026333 [Scortum barcoo]
MDRNAVFEGLTRPCPLPDPGGNGLEPGTNKTGCHLTEDEMLGFIVMPSHDDKSKAVSWCRSPTGCAIGRDSSGMSLSVKLEPDHWWVKADSVESWSQETDHLTEPSRLGQLDPKAATLTDSHPKRSMAHRRA